MPSWIDRDTKKVAKKAERRADVEAWVGRHLAASEARAEFWGADKPKANKAMGADPAIIDVLACASLTEPRELDFVVTRIARREGWLRPVYRDSSAWGCKLWAGDVLTTLGAAYLAKSR